MADREGYEADCEDYHCRCTAYTPTPPIPGMADTSDDDYCLCGCTLEDHGAGFRGAEQTAADEGRAAVEGIFRGLSSN